MTGLLCVHEDCTGCLACFNVCRHSAINLIEDEEGFLYPSINSTQCVDCRLCKNVCPIICEKTNNRLPQSAFAAWANDVSIHKGSSSGGLFSVIALDILRGGGCVYGATFSRDWSVNHVCIESEKQLECLRGSKYLQSYIGNTYQDVARKLQLGKTVLFVGTPCQIAGLNSYMAMLHVDVHNLLTIDLACHGVPTGKVFKDYIKYLEQICGKKIKGFSFRDKHWSWRRFNTKADFDRGSSYLGKWEEDYFMRGFLRDIFLRPSCHRCKFANGYRQGDITLSDYWNYQPRNGEIVDDDNGVSVVLINTEKGAQVLQSIRPQLTIYEREVEDALNSSQPYKNFFPKSPLRDQFWEDYLKNGFEAVVEKYFYPEPIQDRFISIYRYGRRGAECVASFKQVLSNIKNKLRRLMHKNRFVCNMWEFLNTMN